MEARVIRVPDIGEGIVEVELVEWRVSEGDTVAEDQPLAVVMTDKASVEIPSPFAGTVVARVGSPGQMLAVGADLIRIEPLGEAAQAASGASAPPGRVGVDRPLASPSVRRHARERGVDLREVPGSGPGGRVLHEDVERIAAPAPAGAPAPATARTRYAARVDEHPVPVIGLRRRIADKMQEAKRRIPHFSYVEEVDVTELEALRAQLNAQRGAERGHLTPLPFVLRAIVVAVREFPQINARYDDEANVVTHHGAVHVGIATQTDAGLMVPVLRHAEALDLWATAAEIARLAQAARSGEALREELSGSTMTVTSLGALGGIASTPIINAPEVAIVGVNRIVERPMIRGGAVVARQMMNLSSSFDHRVVDGMHGAGFVQALRRCLECPATMFVD